MTSLSEVEKPDAGLEYNFWDEGVSARKTRAIEGCRRLRGVQDGGGSPEQVEEAVRALFGSAGAGVSICPGFMCDNGKNIHVGVNFLTNYNVTILDIAQVAIGDHVMIGPNTLITTVGHPLSPRKRREHLAFARPVRIGNDVWIGGNVTILPGVSVGNNVVVAAGAVVTKDVPDNSVVAGVPARVVKSLENDL